MAIKEEKLIKEESFNIEEENTVQLFNVVGMINTVSAVPANIPTNINDQIKLYKSGATKRLYIYDKVNQEWDYVALT